MRSTRELRLTTNPSLGTAPGRTRLALKDSLSCRFSQFAGVMPVRRSGGAGPQQQQQQERVITLLHIDDGAGGTGSGVNAVLFGVGYAVGCSEEAAKEGGALKAYAKCQMVKYCDRACQRADWKRHKEECVAKK